MQNYKIALNMQNIMLKNERLFRRVCRFLIVLWLLATVLVLAFLASCSSSRKTASDMAV